MKSQIIRKQNVVKYEKQKSNYRAIKTSTGLTNEMLSSFRILSHKIQILIKRHSTVKFNEQHSEIYI